MTFMSFGSNNSFLMEKLKHIQKTQPLHTIKLIVDRERGIHVS